MKCNLEGCSKWRWHKLTKEHMAEVRNKTYKLDLEIYKVDRHTKPKMASTPSVASTNAICDTDLPNVDEAV